MSTKEVCTILRISRPTLWWSWRHDSVGKIMAMTINGDTGASESRIDEVWSAEKLWSIKSTKVSESLINIS